MLRVLRVKCWYERGPWQSVTEAISPGTLFPLPHILKCFLEKVFLLLYSNGFQTDISSRPAWMCVAPITRQRLALSMLADKCRGWCDSWQAVYEAWVDMHLILAYGFSDPFLLLPCKSITEHNPVNTVLTLPATLFQQVTPGELSSDLCQSFSLPKLTV